MFNLIGMYEGKKVGFVGDLVFGFCGGDVVFVLGVLIVDGGFVVNVFIFVNQLYVYWNVSDNVILILGNFNIFLGYEVIFLVGNFNYLILYMFFYGLFFYMGLKVDFGLGEDLSLMFGVFNFIDFIEVNVIGFYSLGVQLGYKGVYFNLLYGDQDGDFEGSVGLFFQVDFIVGFDLIEDFYLGVNVIMNLYDVGSESDCLGFYGFVGYV